MRKLLILLVFLLAGCTSGGVAPLIKSTADTAATVATVTENLLRDDIISVEDAESVHLTLEQEVIPRIKAAEKAYGEWRVQAEVHGINNEGDKTAAQYITFAKEYLSGVCHQLNLEFCQEK